MWQNENTQTKNKFLQCTTLVVRENKNRSLKNVFSEWFGYGNENRNTKNTF